jgi:chemotaxis protein MotB
MATPGAKLQPIIVRRIKKGGHGAHHSSGWKIAYADFVTAMMAFFLLMWLLGSTSQGDLEGIAAYFKAPLKVSLSGGSGSGDSSSIIKAGGTNLTRTTGATRRGEIDSEQRNLNLQALRAEIAAQDALRMQELRRRIESTLAADPALAALRHQIRIDPTPDGLRVQIVDDQGRPMFNSGSARVNEHMRDLLRSLGGVLQASDARLLVSGHTDAAPYSGGERGYSNWELSADRANASRRELVAGGLGEDSMVRVMGMGSSVPFDREDALSPLNRRISILVLGRLGRERYAPGSDTPISESEALERMLARREAAAASLPSGATPPSVPSLPGAKP